MVGICNSAPQEAEPGAREGWTGVSPRRPAFGRGGLLLALVLVLIQAFAGAPSIAFAQADPLGHADRADSLYRVFVSLDGEGHPLLPLSVLAGQQQIEVRAPSGLRVIGTGDGSVEVRVPGDKATTVSGRDFKPGERRYYVAVGAAPGDDLTALRALRQRWQALGDKTRHFGIGATYALQGRGLDTRRTVICLEEGHRSKAAASTRAHEISARHQVDAWVHTRLMRPPQAILVARTPNGAEVHAADVIWLEALPNAKGQPQLLEVTGKRRGRSHTLTLPGRIYLTAEDNGRFAVVNEARIEKILAGVVAAEIYASAPMEALKAQAVAARTDMLAKVGQRHHTDPFSICSEVHCQAYGGMQRINPRVAAAVKDTRGMVLTDPKRGGRLVDAFYCAASGGHTEHNDNAWTMPPHPTLRGLADLQPGARDFLAGVPDEAAVRAHLAAPDRSYAAAAGKNKHALRWQVSRSRAELKKSLAEYGVPQDVRAMKVIRRGVSGRIVDLEVTLRDRSKRVIHGELRIRRAFKGLRSSLFVFEAGRPDKQGVPETWRFAGAGYGHGVGLDQTGAMGRAAKGQSFREITAHYYTGSKLEKLY